MKFDELVFYILSYRILGPLDPLKISIGGAINLSIYTFDSLGYKTHSLIVREKRS